MWPAILMYYAESKLAISRWKMNGFGRGLDENVVTWIRGATTSASTQVLGG